MENTVEKSQQENGFEGKEYFDVYWRYSTALRNWFVLFGVGGCILFISDKAEMFKEVCQQTKRLIIGSFIAGVALQIFLVFMNKVTHWCVYYGKVENKDFRETRRYKFFHRLSNWFIIDFLIDVLTVIAFGIATGYVFYILFC
ncbi:MAG: hypothetical protein ACYS0I_13445 [Planctomycetota bacterium]|jgi:riboflavin transporter FmnP